MGIACKVSGHKWNGCVCTRCGERRDEGHNYRLDKQRSTSSDQCVIVCSSCGAIKSYPHEWNGCTCLRCGATRDEHLWQGCKCTVCGKVRDEGHEWSDILPYDRENHTATCAICGEKRRMPHTFDWRSAGCQRTCAECGYARGFHEFRDGECIGCGVDESDYYGNLILSGWVRYGDYERDATGDKHLTYGDHVKRVAKLREIALSDKESIYSSVKTGCVLKLREIAEGNGPDAHDANLALRDIVLSDSLGWDTLTAFNGITDPEIASDPKVIAIAKRVQKASDEYDNIMIAMDSGIGRSG